MHETVEELEQLQRLLDRSYLKAGAHLRSVLRPDIRLNAADLVKLLRGVCVLDLATVSPKGQPIVAPVDGLFYHGMFYFGSASNSVRFRHIRRNPRVSAAYTVGVRFSMLVHGQAREIDTKEPAYTGLHSYFREVYGADYDSWGYWGNMPHACIEPRQIFATLFDPTLLDEVKAESS